MVEAVDFFSDGSDARNHAVGYYGTHRPACLLHMCPPCHAVFSDPR